MSLADEVKRHLCMVSVSKNRLGRLVVLILLSEGDAEDKHRRALSTLLDYGYSKEEAEKRLAQVIESLSKIEVCPGPVTFGG